MVKQCVFKKTDIIETDRYPLMRVWFETDTGAFYWIPKWADLYSILGKAIEVEDSNWYQSEWKNILNNIKRVLEKRQTKPFIPRKRRTSKTLLTVGATKGLEIRDKKLLKKIRKNGDIIKCPSCNSDVHIEETECPTCGYHI